MSDENHTRASAGHFLVGRSIYLRSPSIERDVVGGRWHEWFNDQINTKYISHGVFPVTMEMQAEYVRAAMSNASTLLLAIVDIQSDEHIGVISLKNIDLISRAAEIGIVMAPGRAAGKTGAIEAMAVLMKHAFSRLNLDMLYAGQHEGLWKWVNTLSLIGFRIDGIRQHAGRRDGISYSVFLTSVLASEFRRLEQQRGGDILSPSPLELLRGRPRENPMDLVGRALQGANEQWICDISKK
ncbi:GNAT family protein [Hyphomicrobium sp.]|uniref:GNAT family N-acetyltransferase n=1 Tax=Hyphomicrobium sp. TaxID=82 RepID=UPI0025BCFAEF|nr:GNAT family protein [Hyphomicrobium sp.]MCC7250944.1 GNAT family N-acetyltransferase [Hyphomicrobium sp.]